MLRSLVFKCYDRLTNTGPTILVYNALRFRYRLAGALRILSPGQTIATVQCNISQRCWPSIFKPQTVACLWSPCCNMLRFEDRASALALAQRCCTSLTKKLKQHSISTNVA